MLKKEANRRIGELTALLEEANRKYYVESRPTLSDFEFDSLLRELQDLEAEWPELARAGSPTGHVGSDLRENGKFVQRPHRFPMLSLANTYSISEIEEFAARAEKLLEGKNFSYCCELKFDGTSISLTYKGGKLVQALTRGDGEKGDDVTAGVRHIKSIPHSLKGDFPDELDIRGEILMPYDSFDRLNAQRELEEEAPFANPRNAASGSLKLSDPAEVGRRGLTCTLYHIPAQSVDAWADAPGTHSGLLDKASEWGLPVSEHRRICHSISDIKAYIDHWDKARKELPFATDGIVIKIDGLEFQKELGYTAKSPRWAVAYKFKAEQALTEVVGIDYQVGRTGAVTPVANLAPVLLSGTVVKRATLNNADQMALLDVRVGDRVYVEKGGEIIPKITGVEFSQRPAGSKPEEFPSVCPDCGTPLVRQDAKWYCPASDTCPMQIKGRILHFLSRKAMDILAGEATVDQLFEAGMVSSPADLYDLKAYMLIQLEGWQKKSVGRFIDSLKESTKVPFERVLYALGIRQVGEQTAKDVARHFGTVDALAAASEEEIARIRDVGPVVAGSIKAYFESPVHLEQIRRLKQAGLRFSTEGVSAQGTELEGKTIVVSGNFSIPRETLKEIIAAHGGKNSGSVSSKTSFLLAGSKPGPEKIAKCAELGIPTVSEPEFRDMLPAGTWPIDINEEPSLFQI